MKREILIQKPYQNILVKGEGVMFFMILSIIGKLLLTILKILLILFLFIILFGLLIIFVPVRYRFNGSYYQNELRICTRFSWLLNLLSFRIEYDGDKTGYDIRVFGIKLFPRKEKRQWAKKKQKKSVQKKYDRVTSEKKSIDSEKKVDKVTKDAFGSEKNTESAEDKLSLTPKKQIEINRIDNTKQSENNNINENVKKKSKTNRITNIINAIKRLFSTIKSGNEKAEIVKAFIFGAESYNLICFVRDNVLHLWRYIRPGYVMTDITLGFENPALTGQMLGVIAAFCGMAGIMPNITPDFENKIFEGEVEIKGRIMVFILLKIMVKVYLSEEIKDFRKEYERIREVL